jgi:CGNR zinc finger
MRGEMETAGDRLPQPVHDHQAAPAPGDLELVRGFLTLHDHQAGNPDSLEPSTETMAWWLHDRGLLPAVEEPAEDDLVWMLDVRDALVTRVLENMGAPPDAAATERLNAAVADTGLRPRFGQDRLEADAGGIRGAAGRLLGISFLAELDGTWHRFRRCADPTCLTVFYDRTKNHSGKWCSMQSCGNRNKVRAFRERHAAET